MKYKELTNTTTTFYFYCHSRESGARSEALALSSLFLDITEALDARLRGHDVKK